MSVYQVGSLESIYHSVCTTSLHAPDEGLDTYCSLSGSKVELPYFYHAVCLLNDQSSPCVPQGPGQPNIRNLTLTKIKAQDRSEEPAREQFGELAHISTSQM